MTQVKVKRPQLKRVITDAVVQVDVKWRPFWGRFRTEDEEQHAIRREAEEVLETVQQLRGISASIVYEYSYSCEFCGYCWEDKPPKLHDWNCCDKAIALVERPQP